MLLGVYVSPLKGNIFADVKMTKNKPLSLTPPTTKKESYESLKKGSRNMSYSSLSDYY